MKWIKRLYEWTLKWAESKYCNPALFFISMIEAIFFPIPPDLLLAAMCASMPKRSFLIAGICTAGSVVGAVIGYQVGALFWESSQHLFLGVIFPQEIFEKVVLQFQEAAGITVFLAGFTPIPFKVITVASGVAQIDFGIFMLSAISSRGLRFFIEGGLFFFFGEPIKAFIDKHFEWLTLAVGILVIGGFVALKFL